MSCASALAGSSSTALACQSPSVRRNRAWLRQSLVPRLVNWFGADAETEGDDGDESETGRATQRPEGEAEATEGG